MMTAFRTGVHTIEFKTTEYLKTTELPTAYRNALEPLGSMRYKMNMTKLPGTKEYDTPADTQRAIREAFTMFVIPRNALYRVCKKPLYISIKCFQKLGITRSAKCTEPPLQEPAGKGRLGIIIGGYKPYKRFSNSSSVTV